MWCNEYSEILSTLSGLKEYDPLLQDKVRVSQIHYERVDKDQNKQLNQEDDLLHKYLINIKEYKPKSWTESLAEVEYYIIANNKLPSSSDNNADVRVLGNWVNSQKQNFKNQRFIMKDNCDVRDAWIIFFEKHGTLFHAYDRIWMSKLIDVQIYIDNHKKLPLSSNDNAHIRILGHWIQTQKFNFKNNRQIMKDNNGIRDAWKCFVEKNEKLLASNDVIWYSKLVTIQNYINVNHELPTSKNDNPAVKALGKWIETQKHIHKNYKNIMKDNIAVRDAWVKFVEKNDIYFYANKTWRSKLNEIETYIHDNNKLPSSSDNDTVIKALGLWIHNQKSNFRNHKLVMKDDSAIRDTWMDFIQKYETYFFKKTITKCDLIDTNTA